MLTEVQAVCNLLGTDTLCACADMHAHSLRRVISFGTGSADTGDQLRGEPGSEFLGALELPFVDGRTASCAASVMRELV